MKLYPEVIKKFAKEGFRESVFSTYFKAPNALIATQFMMPDMDAQEGPKAYGVDKEVKPSRWCALYKGKVSPPKTGTLSLCRRRGRFDPGEIQWPPGPGWLLDSDVGSSAGRRV